ncbi:hypothetical protein Ae201684P_015326 [Aphanomyces euteiches]|nr:hypothetical protein Ae201684P_015326 [Aphanomyces euteiches]
MTLALLAAAQVNAASCPYTNLPASVTNVLVADKSLCPAPNATCIVTKACRYVGWQNVTDWAGVEKQPANATWQAIGDLRGWQPSTRNEWLTLNGQGRTIDMSLFQLNDIVTSLYDQHSHAIMVLVHSTWNSSSSARQTPEIICIPEQAQDIGRPSETSSYAHMAATRWEFLHGVDQLGLQRVDALVRTAQAMPLPRRCVLARHGATRTSLASRTSRSAVASDLHDMNISSWIMDADTFQALNGLQPHYFCQDKEKDDGWGYIGYNNANLTIDSNATECASKRGTIQELWGANKTARQKPYDQSVYHVCVLSSLSGSSSKNTSNSSSLSTAAISGISVGGAALIGIVVFVKSTKLTDFGVSKEDLQATMTVGVGVILSEFDTHRIPYEDLTNPSTGLPIGDSAILVSVVQGEIKPTFSRDCPPWIYDMAMQCLAHNPDDRPTAMQLSHSIRTKLKEISTGLFTI